MWFFRLIQRLIFFVFFLLILIGIAVLILPLPGQIPVLMYHFIGTEEQAYQEHNMVSQAGFKKQMDYLEQLNYRVISLDEYDRILSGRAKPRGREIVITFDDGNYTFNDLAYPILQKHRFPATVFLVSESVKAGIHGSMKQDVIERLLLDPMVQIGGHSKTHPQLPEISDEALQDEIAGGKKDLETLFQRPVDYFAYPYGEFDSRVVRAVQAAGYHLAFTTSPKKLRDVKAGPYAVTRVKMDESAVNPAVFWVKASGLYNAFKHFREQMKSRAKNA